MLPQRYKRGPFKLVAASFVVLMLLLASVGFVLFKQRAAVEELNRSFGSAELSATLAQQLRQSSDDLTRMARTYAVTGDERFEGYFYTVLGIRNGTIPRPQGYEQLFWDLKVAGDQGSEKSTTDGRSTLSMLQAARFTEEEFELLRTSQERAGALVEKEETAINAMKGRFRDEHGEFTIKGEPDREMALKVLFGEEYHSAKSQIMQPIKAFLKATEDRLAEETAKARERSRSLTLILAALFLSLVPALCAFTIACFRYHRYSMLELRDREENLETLLNAPLETIMLVARDGALLDVNVRGARRFGMKRREMRGRNLYSILPAQLSAELKTRGEHVLDSGETVRFDDERDGLCFSNSIYPVFDPESGEVSALAVFAEDVTERKRFQQERDRLLSLSQDIICVASTDGYLKYVNPAAEKILGYTNAELLAKPFVEFIHHDDREPTEQEVTSLASGNSTFGFENRYITKSGEIRFISWTATPVKEENVIYSIGRDVTSARNAEAKLRQSEQRFRSLVKQSPIAIEILSPDGRIKEVNNAWMRLWSVNESEAEEIISQYSMLSDPQIEALGIGSLVRKAFSGESTVLPPVNYSGATAVKGMGLDHITPKAIWCQCHLYPVRDEHGDIAFIVNMYQDITETRGLQSELKSKEAHLIRAQDVASCGSWELDVETGSLYWSERVYEMFGVSREEPLTFDLFASKIHPDDLAYVQSSWQEALKGSDYDIEHRIVVDDEIRWVREKAEVDFDKEGKAVKGVGIVQDITKLRKAQADAREQREALARMGRTSSMGQLTGSISHELNQPLTGILSNAQAGELMIENDACMCDEMKEILSEIISDAKRAGDVIHNLRDLYREHKGELVAVDINGVIEAATGLLRSELVKEDVKLELQGDDSLPEVLGNKVQLEQVLVNLMMNGAQAMKKTPKDKKTLRVNASCDDGHVKVWMDDCGIGINMDNLDRLFEPLATWKPGGTGMGLAISNSIIEAHGGKMWAENLPEGGARVGFSIPAVSEGRGTKGEGGNEEGRGTKGEGGE